eukprot:1157595-Pelagomonas_calceolata.AAC.5
MKTCGPDSKGVLCPIAHVSFSAGGLLSSHPLLQNKWPRMCSRQCSGMQRLVGNGQRGGKRGCNSGAARMCACKHVRVCVYVCACVCMCPRAASEQQQQPEGLGKGSAFIHSFRQNPRVKGIRYIQNPNCPHPLSLLAYKTHNYRNTL